MPGGLLNIVAVGNANQILTGNPSKTFFKVTYSKYSNFGLQKFRIDYDGQRDLRLTEPSTFHFKIPRYAELLMDTYLVVTLPDIWSPLYPPVIETNKRWTSYDFKWIKNLGTHMIKEIVITCGSLTLQKYTGEYLAAMVERDFTSEKKDLFYKMTGNTPELNDPSNANGRANTYPCAFHTSNTNGAEPTIRSRNLYIPINTWFTLDSRCAFPLICLQNSQLEITVTMRPIQEIFQVRDIFDYGNLYPYVQPDFNKQEFQMYRFLQTPPSVDLKTADYTNKISNWNADIHLLSTYCFLSQEEAQLFAMQDQVYLVKDVFQYNFENVTGSKRVKLNSNGMVSNWMFYLQRNDVNMRNEWSNYTNWPYRAIPGDLQLADTEPIPGTEYNHGPGIDDLDGRNTGIYITGDYNVLNQKEILEGMGILLNGEYRENMMTRGIYDYIEKYVRTNGSAPEGLYCYNFALHSSPFEYQPSGAINMSKFKTIELEVNTYAPPIDPVNSSFDVICDADGNAIGINKSNWRLFEYNYNLTLFEERYNILSFIGGNCGMLYSR
jgi:Major capsid protein N-terminus/Large eukaryotic DNA virus major capsid protein